MKVCKKLIAAILVAAMLLMSVSAFAEVVPEYPEVPDGYDGYATMSVEAFTLGWGYIVEPTLVPYVEGESVAIITDRLLNSLGIEYEGGSLGSGFYFSRVECEQIINGEEPNVPEFLMEQFELNPGYWSGEESGDGMLGEFDYSSLAGWIIADDDELAPVGAGSWEVEQGHTYRWMFTIYGYGMDLGMSDGWGMFPPYDNPATGVSRIEAGRMYSLITADPDLSQLISEDGAAYEEFVEFNAVMEYLGSTQSEIDTALSNLLNALDSDPIIPGDVDGNGIVTIADAIMILRYSINVLTLTGTQLEAADIDGNGFVNIADALNVMRVSIG